MHAMKRNSRRDGVRTGALRFRVDENRIWLVRRALRMVGHTGREI